MTIVLTGKSEPALNEIARDITDSSVSIRVHYWGVNPSHHDNPVHKHSFYEVCYVMNGEGSYHEGDAVYPLQTGTLFISRPGTLHQIRSQTGMFLPFVAFELDPRSTSADWSERFALTERTGRFVVRDADESDTALIWRALLQTAERSDPDEVSVRRLAMALLLSIPHMFADESPKRSDRVYQTNASLLHQAVLYVRDNLSEPLRMEDVAGYLHISGRHLSRIFAERMMKTFNDYVRTERVRQAARLLRETNKTVQAVSEETGFGSVHYFTRVFTCNMGITPAAYRKQQQDAECMPMRTAGASADVTEIDLQSPPRKIT